jgi:hypothetical protein
MNRPTKSLALATALVAIAACGSSKATDAMKASPSTTVDAMKASPSTTVDAMHANASTTADAMMGHASTTADAMMGHASTTADAMMAHMSGAADGDFVKASDQSGDGSVVTVEDAGLSGHSGFVVVVADNGGAMGGVLGVSKLLPPGTTMGVTVHLSSPLSGAAKVFVVLHVDNGDGTFTAADAPAMVGGQVVELPITVTAH